MSNITPDKNFNSTVFLEDGSNVRIYSGKLHALDLNHFKGWNCEAGFSRICVLPDSQVYSGECGNDYLGKLDDDTFRLLSTSTTCKKDVCTGNPADIMLRKKIQN